MTGLPATLGASDEHYRRLGVSKDHIELWEDGMRTDGGKGTYEWWYFDAYLNDGSKLAITFRTKPIIDVGKTLDPWIDLNLERADGASVDKHLHIEPEHFSASKETCDVVMRSNSFKGDLHTYSIHVDAEGMVVDVSLTSRTAQAPPPIIHTAPVPTREACRLEKRVMTDIYVELGGKKAIAWSVEWPGWCRIRASEAEAVQALIDYEVRYQLIAQRAGLDFAPGDLVVVERLQGNANTAWGVPSVMAPAESRPIYATTAQRNVALLRASWDMLEEVVATSPAELRKGPRGGGRDRDEVRSHVIEAERVYARKIGVRHKPFEMADISALNAMREEIAAVLSKPSKGKPLVDGGWNASYAVRRMAWHVVDHIWEIEDRRN